MVRRTARRAAFFFLLLLHKHWQRRQKYHLLLFFLHALFLKFRNRHLGVETQIVQVWVLEMVVAADNRFYLPDIFEPILRVWMILVIRQMAVLPRQPPQPLSR